MKYYESRWMTRLPKTLCVGGVTLMRTRNLKGRPTNCWVDSESWNELERRRDGKWLWTGSPLTSAWDHDEWRDTPLDAYIANLNYQQKQLKQKYKSDWAILVEAMKEAR